MYLFRYLDDKDVFLALYSRLLAKRLLVASGPVADAEGEVIAKLEDACGSEYTGRLRRMITGSLQDSTSVNGWLIVSFKTSA